MNPQFKVYQIDIDEGDLSTGVEYVALVDDPAILRTWQAFNAEQIRFQTFNDATGRHIVQGPLMIPDMPIYRNDPTHGEHYVIYSKDSIQKIARKFFRMKNTGNVNLMHIPSATVNDVYMIESFIIDSERGIHAPDGFKNLPDGTWFGSYYVENEKVWQEVTNGTFKGFSVEGFFNYGQEEHMSEAQVNNLISAITNGTLNGDGYLPLIKQKGMGLLNKLGFTADKMNQLKSLLFGDTTGSEGMLKDGTQVYADGGFVQGATLWAVTAEGKQPVADGKYELDNGITLEVMNGVIMNVTEAPIDQQKKTDQEMNEQQVKQAIEAATSAFNSKLEELASTVKGIADKFAATETATNEMKAEFAKVQEANKQIFSLLKKLESEPATAPTHDEEKPKEQKTSGYTSLLDNENVKHRAKFLAKPKTHS